MFNDKHRLFIDRVMKVMAWRLDIESNEMIECVKDGEQYCKDHLSIKGTISQRDMDAICYTVNEVLYQSGSTIMVANNMGEFLPTKFK